MRHTRSMSMEFVKHINPIEGALDISWTKAQNQVISMISVPQMLFAYVTIENAHLLLGRNLVCLIASILACN